jgi:3-oxocholest-4-en-26-oate---CoA ligase
MQRVLHSPAVPGWNFADAFEVVADTFPEATAQVQGDRRITWRDFDRRSDGVALRLLEEGAQHQDKVALYLHNGPEYLEACVGAWKAGLVPVNTNYRYTEDELAYLWDNADAVAVVFHGTFAATAAAVREQVPTTTWLWVDDGSGPCPDWATPYEDAAALDPGRTVAEWGRDGDDLLMLYTGGTTGMPKGVMWRQHDLFLAYANATLPGLPREADLDEFRSRLTAPGAVHIPACPLMHGTGWFTGLMALMSGGCNVTLTSRSFDVVELLDTIEREGVNTIAIVGDAFAKPMLRALDAEPGRWDLSSLVAIISSGVMWSEPVKQGLLRHHPGMLLHDAFSSSEALNMGVSMSTGDQASATASFTLGPDAIVVGEDGQRVEPGSGEIGRVAVGGAVPVGYYKDPEKSAATFIEIDGARYSMPGDWAQVEVDGSLTVLGRGSVCINTGGEKVFPEEVEEALKSHPAVFDAVAVGVPDDRFGEAVTGVVEPSGDAPFDEAEVIAHVKATLAAYKAPKRILVVDTIGRAPNGKVDYQRLRSYAEEQLTTA